MIDILIGIYLFIGILTSMGLLHGGHSLGLAVVSLFYWPGVIYTAGYIKEQIEKMERKND